MVTGYQYEKISEVADEEIEKVRPFMPKKKEETSDDDSDEEIEKARTLRPKKKEETSDDDSDDDSDEEIEKVRPLRPKKKEETSDDDLDEKIEEKPMKPVITTNSSVEPFGLVYTVPNVLFGAPNKYVPFEKTTVSLYDMSSRLFRELNGCLDGFEWKHACISGGLLTGLIEKKYDSAIYKDSDIDLFIYGQTPDQTKQYFSETFRFIQSKCGDLCVKPLQCENIMVINLCTKQLNRTLQMIGISGIESPLQLINRFDLSHCQIAYDGAQFVCTNEFTETMRTRQTRITSSRTSLFRLYKTYMRGFSVLKPDHPVRVTNSNGTYDLRNLLGITDDITDVTLEKILSFTKTPINKELNEIKGDAITEWFTKYIQTHAPCNYQ
jgi:hypothetical protein